MISIVKRLFSFFNGMKSVIMDIQRIETRIVNAKFSFSLKICQFDDTSE